MTSEELKGKVLYIGQNVKIFMVNGYLVGKNHKNWICDCGIKYNRAYGVKCKHIKFCENKEK